MSRIRELRLARKWSLDELCRRSGVSRSNLWAIERQGRVPTVEVGRKIANAFGVTLDELFPESEKDPKEVAM